jgi:hypothetical protein
MDNLTKACNELSKLMAGSNSRFTNSDRYKAHFENRTNMTHGEIIAHKNYLSGLKVSNSYR